MRLPCLFAGPGGTSAGSTVLLGRQGAELVLHAIEHEVDAAVDAELAVDGGEVITQRVPAEMQGSSEDFVGRAFKADDSRDNFALCRG